MAQLTGSGPGNGANYAMVDDSVGTNDGRLFTTGSNTSTQIYEGTKGPVIVDDVTFGLQIIASNLYEVGRSVKRSDCITSIFEHLFNVAFSWVSVTASGTTSTA